MKVIKLTSISGHIITIDADEDIVEHVRRALLIDNESFQINCANRIMWVNPKNLCFIEMEK